MTQGPPRSIRRMQPDDHPAIAAFMAEAGDYWHLADGTPPDPQEKARDFFTDCPPNCDPAASHRLGLFVEGQLSGLAELSFGFPEAGDAYLGLMLLAPRIRGQGHGAAFLREVETRARAARAPALYLGVLEINPKGRAFWQREGFGPTGISRGTGRELIHRLRKPL